MSLMFSLKKKKVQKVNKICRTMRELVSQSQNLETQLLEKLSLTKFCLLNVVLYLGLPDIRAVDVCSKCLFSKGMQLEKIWGSALPGQVHHLFFFNFFVSYFLALLIPKQFKLHHLHFPFTSELLRSSGEIHATVPIASARLSCFPTSSELTQLHPPNFYSLLMLLLHVTLNNNPCFLYNQA